MCGLIGAKCSVCGRALRVDNGLHCHSADHEQVLVHTVRQPAADLLRVRVGHGYDIYRGKDILQDQECGVPLSVLPGVHRTLWLPLYQLGQ